MIDKAPLQIVVDAIDDSFQEMTTVQLVTSRITGLLFWIACGILLSKFLKREIKSQE